MNESELLQMHKPAGSREYADGSAIVATAEILCGAAATEKEPGRTCGGQLRDCPERSAG